MENRCVICGTVIPEGRQVCPGCEDGKNPVAAKPGKCFSGSGVTWWYVCGFCRTSINPNDKYCHECGKVVDWS